MTDILSDSYLGLSRDELKARILQLVGEGTEGPKLDFKRTIGLDNAAEKAEFCKDLSAIANSDGNHFAGYGYIVLGAADTKLVGGVAAWERTGPDQFSARLTEIAKQYLAPPPEFAFAAFEDDTVGHWGVIVIPPSSEQPHVFVRELSGNPARHEWFVRVNDTTERAGIADYARIMSSATKRATRSLEAELQTLKLQFERFQAGGVGAADMASAIAAQLRGSPPPVAVSLDDLGTVSQRIKRAVMTPQHTVEDRLIEDALRVQQLMLDDRPENPQRFASSQPEDLLQPLVYMEEQTRAFAEAIVAVVRYDDSQRFVDSVVQAVDVVAEEPSLAGPHWQYMQELRLYPLVLTLYTLAFVSAGRNDGRLLRRVLDLDLRAANRAQPEPMVWALRSLRATKDVFNGAQQQRYYEPIAERISQVVPGWCASAVPGKRGQDVFYLAEFALALEHAKVRTLFHGAGVPFAGTYFYHLDAERVLVSALRRRPKFLTDLFGEETEKLLMEFDANAAKVAEGGFRRGFVSGALAAWKGEEAAK